MEQAQYVLHEPKFFLSSTISIKGESPIVDDYVGDVPEEIMAQYQQIIGNGMARVTVSADVGVKTFGTGASAMCSVSLSCNQDGASIQQAAVLAGDLARRYATEQQARVEAELTGIIEQRKLQNPNYGR